MKRKALITGVSGQDGSYLAEHLLEKDYEVYGLIRRKAHQEHEMGNSSHLEGDMEFLYGDVTDSISVRRAIDAIVPDEVYNLAGQSQVRISFEVPEYTFQVNTMGTLNVLEAVRAQNEPPRFYQAGSSEMFGAHIKADGSQDENTPMHPVSPYGTSKLAAHVLVQNYRNSYGMFAANGILFNHESPRRGQAFVTQKIVYGATRIQMGQQKGLELGNLKVARDWGHAKDYVRAMWLMLQADEPDDFVVATGRAVTLEKIIDHVFYRMEMDWKLHIRQNEKFFRPSEVPYLKGNPSKVKNALKWKPKYSLEALLDDMIAGAKRQLDGGIYR